MVVKKISTGHASTGIGLKASWALPAASTRDELCEGKDYWPPDDMS